MDMVSGKQQFINCIKKYQYVLLVALAGIILMLMPQTPKEPQQSIISEDMVVSDLEAELAAILSRISGVGKAEVLLTEASGSNTIYQVDAGQNHSTLDTVIVRNGDREETGLVKQVLPPAYRGAIIVCQGADHASVRLSVLNAVRSVTGISSDCITVLKMK